MKENKPEQYNIPKIIHFIWAGGSKKLPKGSCEVVKAWCQQNPASVCDFGSTAKLRQSLIGPWISIG